MAKKTISRTDGKLSQRSILEATLSVILDTGIRSVKYKTVAEVAGVTQSAVAYYFSSIPSLIESAFRFYFEKYTLEMSYTREMGKHLLAEFTQDDLQQQQVRKRFLQRYVAAIMSLLSSNQQELKLYLLLDRIFRNETLINKSLYKILKVQDQLDIAAVAHVFTVLNTKQPEQDAIYFMSLLWFIAEKLLQENYSQAELAHAEQLVEGLLQRILFP